MPCLAGVLMKVSYQRMIPSVIRIGVNQPSIRMVINPLWYSLHLTGLQVGSDQRSMAPHVHHPEKMVFDTTKHARERAIDLEFACL